jgi:hypothetical protein
MLTVFQHFNLPVLAFGMAVHAKQSAAKGGFIPSVPADRLSHCVGRAVFWQEQVLISPSNSSI